MHLGNVVVNQRLQAIALTFNLELSLPFLQTRSWQQDVFDKCQNTVIFDNLGSCSRLLDFLGDNVRAIEQVNFAVCSF